MTMRSPPIRPRAEQSEFPTRATRRAGSAAGFALEAMENRLLMDANVLTEFPHYGWYFGCTPTSLAQIFGYYDRSQFTALFPGTDARTRDSIVERYLASDQHKLAGQENRPTSFFGRYIGAGDWHNSPSLPNHEQNPDCIGDFLKVENGGTFLENIGSGTLNYLRWRGYTSGWSVGPRTFCSPASFADIVQSIDEGRPVLGLVDFNGDGVLDHGTSIIGYNTDNNTYACQDPNDSFVRWTPWTTPRAGLRFGVDSFYQIYPPGPATPFSGSAIVAPGLIQAEDFDRGDPGRAYYDLDRRNYTGLYRDTGVGIGAVETEEGGYFVGWTHAGEWTQYSLQLSSAGSYEAQIRLACPDDGASFHLEMDGVDITGPIAMPNTGGWNAWQTISIAGLPLGAGPHVLRLVFDADSANGSAGNVDWIRLVNRSLPAVPTGLVASARSEFAISLNWTDNADNEEGYIIERQGPDGVWTVVATVPLDTAAYKDTGLTPSTTYAYRVRAVNSSGSSEASNEATARTQDPKPVPFRGTPFAIGQTISAADFDEGGEGLAYHDTTSANLGGQYRSTGVDIGSAETGGYYVGWTRAGEWVSYTVKAAATGLYTLDVNHASARDGGRFRVEVDGVNVTGSIAIANTGGWQTWKTISRSGIRLTAGRHIVRLVMEANNSAGSVGNFRWIKFR
jgi:hypothetical protein